jgi:glycosyltransferase involved in cell wall biosynthesis
MSSPAVSVIIATRNRPALLPRALSSIAMQDWQDYEVIVVDDGSDAAVLDQYCKTFSQFDERFILYTPSAPAASGTGPGIARNRGIQKARGEFIAFLDDDDIWLLPDHLRVAVEAMRRYEADYYFTNIRCEPQGSRWVGWIPDPLALSTGKQVFENPAVYDVPSVVLAQLTRKFLVNLDVSVIRRSLLLEIEGFWYGIRFSEDWNLMFRVADRARRILYRPDTAASYELPQGNSVTLTEASFSQKSQEALSQWHSWLYCSKPLFRKSARLRTSWFLRKLSQEMLAQGFYGDAVRTAGQAIFTYASARNCANLFLTTWQAFFRSLFPRRSRL